MKILEKRKNQLVKRIVSFMLCTSVLLSINIFVSAAKVGDIVGKAVYTDIVAKINNYDIASFNINGETAVVVEDLRNYGCDVQWDASNRTLSIRQGEILALSFDDINLTEMYISVNKTLTYPSNTAVLQLHTKTKSGMREVKIGEPLITVLKEYIKTIPNNKYLFQMKDGSLFSKTAKENLWNQIRKKINYHMPEGCETNITSHFLRHNYASDLCNTNMPVKHIQYLLGHANIQTTLDIYAEVREEKIDISSMEEYWKSNAIS